MQEPSTAGTTVDQLYEETLRHGAIVDASARLIDVVETLAFQEALHAVYVVDVRDRYLGVVTRSDLVGWIEHNLEAPQVRDAFPWGVLGDEVRDASAEDAVNPKSAEIPVEPIEPVEHALRGMLAASLPVVPVVSADGSIEGELTLTRLLRHALEDPG